MWPGPLGIRTKIDKLMCKICSHIFTYMQQIQNFSNFWNGKQFEMNERYRISSRIIFAKKKKIHFREEKRI